MRERKEWIVERQVPQFQWYKPRPNDPAAKAVGTWQPLGGKRLLPQAIEFAKKILHMAPAPVNLRIRRHQTEEVYPLDLF